MSRLRARCPDCGILTAVAVDPGYECHACGRAFAAGLVRVPRAWGTGGGEMAAAASLPLPFPETAVVACPTLERQSRELAACLPERPLVLGGCCCAHTGAIAGLAARVGRLAVVWLDAHGDLNTPETSPSGNAWGMPLRAAIDAGHVRPEDVALVGARDLDPSEREFIAAAGIDADVPRALAGADAVYVALDADVLDEREIACFMPAPDGLSVHEVASVLEQAVAAVPLAGLGVTGLVSHPANVPALTPLLRAAGL